MFDLASINAPITRKTVLSRDGTPIRVYVAGRGARNLVLAPGLGANLLCWKYILEGFQGVYRITSWDPRGTYESGTPHDDRDLDLPHHVEDMEAVVESEGLRGFVLGGWSMGVQIALEYTIRHPGMARALVLINGHYGHLLRDVLNLPGAEVLCRRAIQVLRTAMPALQPVAPSIFQADWMPMLLARTGVLKEPVPLFRPILKEFSSLDFHRYLGMIARLDRHTTEPNLHRLQVPTLITAGTKDFLTPPSVGRKLQQFIPGSELVLLEGGTHYSMMELPRELHVAIESFLRRVDPNSFAPARTTTGGGYR
jgi:pimeloyl-ACP methyl ester carboxylesterase